MRASPMADRTAYADVMAEIRACRVCAAHLPLGPRPVLRGLPSARLLVVSQAPGTRVHETGLSFNDRSGDRLRHWLGIDRNTFYDESRVALLPIVMCYPTPFPHATSRPRRGVGAGRDRPPAPHPPRVGGGEGGGGRRNPTRSGEFWGRGIPPVTID